jgi:uncharacterized membrane protein
MKRGTQPANGCKKMKNRQARGEIDGSEYSVRRAKIDQREAIRA